MLLLTIPKIGQMLAVAYISILVHEVFHCMGCSALKVEIKRIVLLPFGVMLETEERYIHDTTAETVICALGPIANLLMVIAGTILYSKFHTEAIKLFTDTNKAIFIINILPIIPLDGGRILKAYFTEKWGLVQAYNFVKKVSWLGIALLMTAGLWILIETRLNVSYVFIACVLLYSLICEDKQMNEFTSKEMVYSKEKLSKRGMIKTVNLVISDNVPVYKLVKLFSYNCYYIINVVDSRTSKILKTYTEPQIIDILINFGNKIKFSDILSC